jgi:hypothetical protein
MIKFYPDKTKIIFFDLEYFVPLESRNRKSVTGMVFCPFFPDHEILGGSFRTYYPMLDKLDKNKQVWNFETGSERSTLIEIFNLIESEWKPVEKKEKHGSLMLSGIGISHSDIPALVTRLNYHRISSPERIHELIYGSRHIDLSIATYCQFSFNNSFFVYPKSKSQLYQKYLLGEKMETGKAVWDMFDNKDYDAIKFRSEEEVNDILAIYKGMFRLKRKNDQALEKLKKIEKYLQAGNNI